MQFLSPMKVLWVEPVTEVFKHPLWYCSRFSSNETVNIIFTCQCFLYWYNFWDAFRLLVTLRTENGHDIFNRVACRSRVRVKNNGRRVLKYDTDFSGTDSIYVSELKSNVKSSLEAILWPNDDDAGWRWSFSIFDIWICCSMLRCWGRNLLVQVRRKNLEFFCCFP